MPDISYILFNGSVRGELAGACRIENGHSVPGLAVSVSFIDLRTCLGIRSEVFQNEVNILVDQRIEQFTESLCIAIGICAVHHLIHDSADICILLIDLSRIITAVGFITHNFIGAHTEDKGILAADFLNDLHVGAVHCTQCNGTVQHELHIACTGSFLAGC